MRLLDITATPHPAGHRIDLAWVNPTPEQFSRVRVVRRADTHPLTPTDGVAVAETDAARFALAPGFAAELDSGNISAALQQAFAAEQIILAATSLVRIDTPGSKWQILDGDQHYIIVRDALQLAVYWGGRTAVTDQPLPGESMVYYSLFPFGDDPPGFDLLDLRLNRAAALVTSRFDTAGQMAELLPVIYHRYDTAVPDPVPPSMAAEDQVKGQLRRFLDLPGGQLDQLHSFARALLDAHNLERVDGRLLPLLAEWIGWKTDYSLEIAAQRNEIRNALDVYEVIGLIPAVQYTVRRISGLDSQAKEFVHNVVLTNRPERLNLWIRQRSAGGVWSEPNQPLSLNFAYAGRPAAADDGAGVTWLFYHTLKKDRWEIWYKTYRPASGWAPSRPLVQSVAPINNRHPSAGLHQGALWVFWDVYDPVSRHWQIKFTTQSGDGWSEPEKFGNDQSPARRMPFAVVDETDGLWLFWLEQTGGQWQLKYNRHPGAVSPTEPAVTFPADGGADPDVEDDLFVLFNQGLWVFWARQEATMSGGPTSWTIAYRVKQTPGVDDTGWSQVFTLAKPSPGNAHDREPAAQATPGGAIELFWSSNRSGAWSIWHSTLDPATNTWTTAEEIAASPYSQRAPLPIALDGGTGLIYRANTSLTYQSQAYTATTTVDARYAGSTTFDTRNTAKLALRKTMNDFQTYTYDAGKNGKRNDEDWYARDTLGLYLLNGDLDDHMRERIDQVLREFMPITGRVVLIPQSGA